MAFQFHKIPGFTGLANRRDARDIGNGLSKAQNISLDVGGKVRTIGGLADFTKFDGATALTQTAKIAPGSGLFTYGSDHWRGGADTIVDILAADNAASDEGGEVNAVGSWTEFPGTDLTLSSVADTDGAAIASNGTSYIMKGVVANNADEDAYQSATTVIGQKYIVFGDLYNVDLSSMKIQVGTTVATPGDIASSESVGIGSWTNRQLIFTAVGTTTFFFVGFDATSGATGYFDDFYVSKLPRRDINADWLALTDVANAQVDLYNINDDSFTAGLLDFGTVSSFVGASAGDVDFPTVSTITDSESTFLNQGVQPGDVRIVSGCSTTAANNIIFVVERVTAGTVYARGSPFTVTAAEAGTVTLTKYNPVAFHYVNEALRASPADGGVALRPKHYSFADRTHFEGAGSSEKKFSDWFANDVGPVAPTDVEATTANGDGAATNLTAGAGFEIGITRTADDGDWIAGTYIIACAFRYDNGQVSALFVPSTDEEFGTAILDSDSLTLTVRGKNDYDERISGGYIFCRKDESDDAWILLAEISMAEGARATLLGTYNAWAESSTADVAYTANFKSLHPNVDSYESISGIDPTTNVEVFTSDNAFWNASVIGGNRCFIFAPRYTDAGGNLQQFRDRIMYSQVNAYDTFPIGNIIDVVKGDAEDYIMGGIYGNDLLCFKQRTLYIIDISDPDPAGWQMKQDANKGKYPFRGLKHPGAYFETPHGPAWCNEFGVFLYNGSEIVPLLGDKIELSEHPLAYQRYMELTTNDYVEDDTTSLPVAYPFTLETIFRTSVSAATMQFLGIADKDAVGEQARIGMLSSGACFMGIQNTGAEDFGAQTAAADDGEWHHLFGVFASAIDRRIYLDAGTPGTDTTSVTMSANIDRVSAGRLGTSSPGSYYTGDLALLRVWDSELSVANMDSLIAGAPASSVGTPDIEWKPSGISDATWTDSSGNSLDGTVVGATAIYEDSWAKFYTDYSILGYHALTNQIIIMRDCTGKWSSGQDYSDVWAIDLDTGANITGRRIFTKGIAYSNFATDWRQGLIIAEQTSSTSVTIKKFTDEPQSQAVGLIDIRTADIDFGNPAFRKDIDAIIVTYKSSAAQTNPVSYALEDNDAQTAWTRLTGDFDAENNWEKLVLEPTPFPCDSIRLKFDNPTAAGTIEINDVTIRYTEIPEALS